MERLGTLDAEFLHAEDPVQHLHIAGICVFAGPAPRHEDVAALIAGKLHLIPRYRQRIRWVPMGLGRPVWVDDPHFDLSRHLHRVAVPAPGGQDELTQLMVSLLAHPMERDRPLWEAWQVEGLSGDRWALVFRVHHCMVDGISGVDLLTVLLDLEPDAAVIEPQPWTPAPEPSGPALVLDAWAGLAGDIGRRMAAVPEAVRDPLGSARALGDLTAGALRFVAHLRPVPRLSIEGPIGPGRVWTYRAADLNDVKAVGRAFGATVNDVVLSILTGGYRTLLHAHGDDVDRAVLRTLVPVSVRPPDAHDRPDNQVSAIVCELPVHLADPVERLRSIHALLDERKASHMVEAASTMVSLGDLTLPLLVGSATRLVTRLTRDAPQHSIATVMTNVPGPQVPLYCLGREMLEYLPFVPIAYGVRVSTAILSYNGHLAFAVTGDRSSMPDIDVVVAAALDELDELVRLAAESTGGASVPTRV